MIVSEGYCRYAYIILHDYNQFYYLKGVKQELSDYEEEIGMSIPKVPLSDVCGTIVLCK